MVKLVDEVEDALGGVHVVHAQFGVGGGGGADVDVADVEQPFGDALAEPGGADVLVAFCRFCTACAFIRTMVRHPPLSLRAFPGCCPNPSGQMRSVIRSVMPVTVPANLPVKSLSRQRNSIGH